MILPEHRLDFGAPEKLSLEQFMRPYKVRGFIMDAIPELKTRHIQPVGEGRSFGDFRIHLGRYDVDPAKNNAALKQTGVAVVALLDGEKVGASTALTLWVHPAFRTKKLAIELIIEHTRYTDVEGHLHFHRQREAAGRAMSYTPEGVAVMQATYAELVRRGLLLNEPSDL